MLISRRTRKKLEGWFRNYERLKAEGAEYIEDIAGTGIVANYSGMPRGGGGNFIENGVAKGCEAYRKARVVEKTINHFSEIGWDKLIFDRYVRNMGTVSLSLKYYASERTVKYWLAEIMSYALMIALAGGIIGEDEI